MLTTIYSNRNHFCNQTMLMCHRKKHAISIQWKYCPIIVLRRNVFSGQLRKITAACENSVNWKIFSADTEPFQIHLPGLNYTKWNYIFCPHPQGGHACVLKNSKYRYFSLDARVWSRHSLDPNYFCTGYSHQLLHTSQLWAVRITIYTLALCRPQQIILDRGAHNLTASKRLPKQVDTTSTIIVTNISPIGWFYY